MPAIDSSFMKDLKLMDKKLDIKFNGKNFVVVYKRPYGEPANIHLIKAKDGGFRQPDKRDLIFIRSGDLESDRLKDRLDRLSRHCEDIRRDMRRKGKEEISAMTRDNKRQLVNAFVKGNNLGKGNSTFRRVNTKRKGKTIGEIRSEA
jgi:hypothetical protein